MKFKDAILTYIAQNRDVGSYSKFAKICDISGAYLTQLMNGKKTNPSKIVLKKIEIVTGFEIDELKD